jgi:uncharacterized membrane protein YraQ (UPF0718 family)
MSASGLAIRAEAGRVRAAARMPLKSRLIRAGLIGSMGLWVADVAYKAANDISYVSREKCILVRILPRPGFLVYEYFLETMAIVFVGTFIAVAIARRFGKLRRYLPGNPITAFVYGSLIPVCSCAAIPLLSSMRGRLRFTTTMSLVLAAPVLSPYIIVLSFSVLGLKYGVVRILSSFILVLTTTAILGAVERRGAGPDATKTMGGCSRDCTGADGDIYLQTFAVFRRLFPFLLVAGAAGVLLEYAEMRDFMLQQVFDRGPGGVMLWILAGVPLYFCNGAEILFLRPLMTHGFPLGTAIAFSLTSTAICTTSIAMLTRMIKLKLTVVLVGSIVGISLALALMLNSLE